MTTDINTTNPLNLSPEFIVANNLAFFLYDVLETLNKKMDDEAARKRIKQSPKVAAIRNQLKYATADMRAITRKMNDDDQDSFGATADMLLKLLLLIADRSEENDKVLELTCNFVESFKSEHSINIKKFGV